MSLSKKNLVLAVVCFVLATAVSAQHPNVEHGYVPEKVYQFGDLDTVNMFNGNMTLQIPIGQEYVVGDGLSYQLVLSYNSKVWDYQNWQQGGITAIGAYPDWRSNAGLGWQLHLGRIVTGSPVSGDPSMPVGTYYSSPDGADHKIGTYSSDGTYLRSTVTGPERVVEFPNGDRHFFDDASGRLKRMENRHLDHAGQLANVVTLTEGVENGKTIWTINDGHRTQKVTFAKKPIEHPNHANDEVDYVEKVELATFGGSIATYTFEYDTSRSLPRCFDDDPFTDFSAHVSLLSRVVLPDSSTFEMGYYYGNFNSCEQGALASLKVPTYGTVEWDYRGWHLPAKCKLDGGPSGAGQHPFSNSPGIGFRRHYDRSGTLMGTWVYDSALNWGNCNDPNPDRRALAKSLTSWVIDPGGDVTETYFSTWDADIPSADGYGFTKAEYSLPFRRDFSRFVGGEQVYRSRTTYDCNGSSPCPTDVARRHYVNYEYEVNVCSGFGCTTRKNARLKNEVVEYHDDVDSIGFLPRLKETVRSNWDARGHFRTVATTGFINQSSPGSGTTRTEHTEYGQGLPGITAPWILDTYTEKSVTENGSTAKQQFDFDPSDGFLRCRRTLVAGSRSSTDVLDQFIRLPQGDGRVVVRELNYGADNNGIGIADICSATAGSAYRQDHTYRFGVLESSEFFTNSGATMGFKAPKYFIDQNTGLVSASFDTADVRTNFTYDTLGRVDAVKPADSTNPNFEEDGAIEVIYRKASASKGAEVELRFWRDHSPFTGNNAQSAVQLGPFGRKYRELRRAPTAGNDWALKQTTFDALGRTKAVSELERYPYNSYPAVGPPNKTNYSNFDAFGRPGNVVSPDGFNTSLTYLGERVVKRRARVGTTQSGGNVTTTDVTTQETYDGHGRLVQLIEDLNGTPRTTNYEYDVGNRLKKVIQGVQTRHFTYDNRGFLISESHPENGTTYYPKYDARGNLLQKQEGDLGGGAFLNDLTFTYDRASRPRITKDTVTGKPYVDVAWAGNNGTDNWKKGKMYRAWRYNYVVPNGSSTELEIKMVELFYYESLGGKISRRVVEMEIGGVGQVERFVQYWRWNELGNLKRMWYPRCTHTQDMCSTSSAGTAVAVDFKYDRGFLDEIVGYATIGYHPNLQVASVTHPGGGTTNYGIDANRMQRPSSIFTSGLSTNWSTGTYEYDGVGNVTEIGNSWYRYDGSSRLVQSVTYDGVGGGGTAHTRSYGYDAYGNLTSGLPNSTATSPTTNRLTVGNATYDQAGSITFIYGTNYARDALKKVWRLTDANEYVLNMYSADGERVWRYDMLPNASTWALRDLDGRVLAELQNDQGQWSVGARHIYRGTTLVATVTDSETLLNRSEFPGDLFS